MHDYLLFMQVNEAEIVKSSRRIKLCITTHPRQLNKKSLQPHSRALLLEMSNLP